MALSTISNNNQVVAIQAGREVNTPYSYESSANVGEFTTPVNNYSCEELAMKILECSHLPNPFAQLACIAIWTAAFKAQGCI